MDHLIDHGQVQTHGFFTLDRSRMTGLGRKRSQVEHPIAFGRFLPVAKGRNRPEAAFHVSAQTGHCATTPVLGIIRRPLL
jgi:hypothetical protein